ncbi:MAG: hypothetical protein H6730_21640 [Deltaproteobacteria bacterium]|nr:hypothetical protein [Deltaproteobacteria bacterium]
MSRRWLAVLSAGWLLAACADPAETPDAGTLPDTGVETPDTGVETPDSGVETPDSGVETPDSGVEPDAGSGRRVQARGLVPVLGVSANANRTVYGRVNSPTAGVASGPNHVVRTTPAPR